jgi:hypothetical protein
MYKRSHHKDIAQILNLLNSSLLREHSCYFAGGTAIALRYGEFRESVDMDFLVSDTAGYRNLRQNIKKEGRRVGRLYLIITDSTPTSLSQNRT